MMTSSVLIQAGISGMAVTAHFRLSRYLSFRRPILVTSSAQLIRSHADPNRWALRQVKLCTATSAASCR
jgi:hypothetical protein